MTKLTEKIRQTLLRYGEYNLGGLAILFVASGGYMGVLFAGVEDFIPSLGNNGFVVHLIEYVDFSLLGFGLLFLCLSFFVYLSETNKADD